MCVKGRGKCQRKRSRCCPKGGKNINYQECIQKVIDYIEENLKNDLDNSLLAGIAGYSEYHFLRVFREVVHLTPADYIRKRRISEIVRCMERDKRPISDIAFEYGFNSKENFVRAFKSEHHVLPTEYKGAQNSLRLYDKLELFPCVFSVKAQLIKLEPFLLVVYLSDEKIPSDFWNKYNVNQWSKRLSGGAVVEDYGVSDWNQKEHRLDYYIGIRQEEARGNLDGTVTLQIAGGLYAIFQTPPATHFDFVGTIHKTWDYIRDVWLPEHGYERTGGYEFETYVEESRLFSENIYIPVRRLSGADSENV